MAAKSTRHEMPWGSLFRLERRRRKLSKREAGKLLGTTEGNITKWERGCVKRPCHRLLVALSREGFSAPPPMDRRVAWAEDIERARLKKGWTREQLADRLGVPEAKVERLEKAQQNADPLTADLIKQLLGASPPVATSDAERARRAHVSRQRTSMNGRDEPLWGDQIRRARLDKNLSRQRLAVLCGVSVRFVLHAEERATPPATRTDCAGLLRLERSLGIWVVGNDWPAASRGRRIALVRWVKDLTIVGLAHLAGVGRGTLERIEKSLGGNLEVYVLEALNITEADLAHNLPPWRRKKEAA